MATASARPIPLLLLSCRRFTVTSSGGLSDGGVYPSGSLEVVRSTDEDGHVRLSFLDKQGRTLLDRGVLSGDSYADTYYVYDSRGLLRHVLTPAMGSDFSSSSLASSGYSYSYDGLGRLTCGRRPGCGETFYEYDAMDRLVFSQDGVQRASGRWSYYLYDAFGRLTEEGECTVKSPLGGKTVHVRHLYDSYGFLGTEGFTGGVYPAATVSGQGKLTGRVSLATDGSGTAQNLYTAYYYDTRGRVTQAVQSNLLGGHDVTNTVYTFTGKPAVVSHTHTAGGKPTLTEVTEYTYDHAERLTKVEHTLGGVKVTLVSNTYDELGRLQSMSPYGNASQKLTYAYNLRDWLTGISGSKFSQNLYYNTGNGTPCYNGNISGMTWQAGNETTTRGYKFTYDGLNRLLDAVYGEGTSLSSNAGRFTEKVTSYDKNGNILGLHRYGQTGASSYGLIDNLTFTLDGNRLNRVDDAVTASAYNNGFEFKDAVKQANEYAYDANGNLTKDLNRNISNIQYNFLNLPGKVTFGDGSTIEYVYAADGTKLRTKHVINGTTTTTDYCGNVVYENGVQKLLLTEAGYVTLSDRKYHYYLQDHQGNNRVVLNQDGTVEEVNHYYPFGGLFASSTNVQPYKYNGKELDTKNGLNWYDYGARHYDPALGRFTTMDPMAENNYDANAYVYCFGNPVNFVDPLGCDTVPSNEIWDYDMINFRTNGMGVHDTENYISVSTKENKTYHLHEILTGENTGNYMAIEQLGIEKNTGTQMYEYSFVVGKDKLNDFISGDTKGGGFQYEFVRYAINNQIDGSKSMITNMLEGYKRILIDPMNWIPSPLDPSNFVPKSLYSSSPWNRFQMLYRGKYTIKNYGTYQNAIKQKSIDYQKWKQ